MCNILRVSHAGGEFLHVQWPKMAKHSRACEETTFAPSTPLANRPSKSMPSHISPHTIVFNHPPLRQLVLPLLLFRGELHRHRNTVRSNSHKLFRLFFLHPSPRYPPHSGLRFVLFFMASTAFRQLIGRALFCFTHRELMDLKKCHCATFNSSFTRWKNVIKMELFS